MTDLTPPEETTSDKAHAIGKLATLGAAGLIATAGGLGAAVTAFGMQALVELVFRNPLEKRNKEWSRLVGAVLEEVEKRNPTRTPTEVLDNLQKNPSFITTLQQASIYAGRTHQEEKLVALKNAVLHAALPGAPDADLQSHYLRLIDELSPTHLRILTYFADPVPMLVDLNRYHMLPRRTGKLTAEAAAAIALPDVAHRRGIWFPFIRHLEREDLIEDVLREPPDQDYFQALNRQVTPEGQGFLAFIKGPEPNIRPIMIPEAAAFAQLTAQLGSRGRARIFEARPMRTEMVEGKSIVESTGILFPRQAALHPPLQGNPPDLVDVRLSIRTGAHFNVFVFRPDQIRVATFDVPLSFQGEYSFNEKTFQSATHTVDAILEMAETQFQTHYPAPEPR